MAKSNLTMRQLVQAGIPFTFDGRVARIVTNRPRQALAARPTEFVNGTRYVVVTAEGPGAQFWTATLLSQDGKNATVLLDTGAKLTIPVRNLLGLAVPATNPNPILKTEVRKWMV